MRRISHRAHSRHPDVRGGRGRGRCSGRTHERTVHAGPAQSAKPASSPGTTATLLLGGWIRADGRRKAWACACDCLRPLVRRMINLASHQRTLAAAAHEPAALVSSGLNDITRPRPLRDREPRKRVSNAASWTSRFRAAASFSSPPSQSRLSRIHSESSRAARPAMPNATHLA